MKPEVEKQVRDIEKEFSRTLEYYIGDDVINIKVKCDIILDIERPAEHIKLELVVE